MKDISTPEIDSWFNRDMYILNSAKNKMKDLERRLTVAREALRLVRDGSSSTRLVRVAKEALTVTAPKQ